MTDIINSTAAPSAYETLRIQNMERNKKFLTDIGIDQGVDIKKAQLYLSKRKKSANPTNFGFLDNPRKSARLASLNPVDYTILNIANDCSDKVKSDNSRPASPTNFDISSEVLLIRKKSHFKSRGEPDGESLRAKFANMSHFELGSQCQSFGKAPVMAVANNGVLPKFSKYPGMVEWANAFFLWVNVVGQAKSGAYDNSFEDGGRVIQWFGGKRLHPESPELERLLLGHHKMATKVEEIVTANGPTSEHEDSDSIRTVGEGYTTTITTSRSSSSNRSKDGVCTDVFLFVRLEGENYTYLGRLLPLRYVLESQPIVVHWKLCDYDALVSGPHKGNFSTILAAAGTSLS